MPTTGEHRPSLTDQVREHIATVSATGTTDSIEFEGRPVILLTTRGARSGSPRTVPLMRVEHDGVYAVVASGGGAAQDPPWCANVRADPRVEVQDGTETETYVAHEATGEERATWWARAVATFPFYERIQGTIDREIAVFVLEK